jgi:Rps23 Pro-64 3,4-dihydroxylase Tpa1-like proline 4-hydroxylase
MDLEKSESDDIILRLIARGILDHPRFAVMMYAWTKLSYIPWHNDVGHNIAVTIYLNDQWPIDWGGLFLYRDGADIRGYAPRFNTGLRNQGNVLHSTTPVSLDAETPRFTLQLFPLPG